MLPDAILCNNPGYQMAGRHIKGGFVLQVVGQIITLTILPFFMRPGMCVILASRSQ